MSIVSAGRDAPLEGLLDAAKLSLGVQGLAAAIVLGDGSRWIGTRGVSRMGGPPIGEHTLLRIGSVTKTFVATAIAQLVLDAQLELERAVVELVPELRAIRTNGFGLGGVTLRNLLGHRAGLVSDTPGKDWERLHVPASADVLAQLDRAEIAIRPGTRFKYSNFGYGLLGVALERSTGVPADELISARLLAPLGLSDTTFWPDADVDDVAWGHSASAERRPHRIDHGFEITAGQMYSSIVDQISWAAIHLGVGAERSALSSELREELLRPTWAIGDDLCAAMSLAWRVERRDGALIHLFGGGVQGYTCGLGFDREAAVACALMTNGECDPTAPALELLQRAREHERERQRRSLVPPETPFAFAGPLGRDATIAGAPGELRMHGGLADAPGGARLVPVADAIDSFVVRDGRFAGEHLRLIRAADARVCGFTVGGWRYARRCGED